MEGLLPWQVVLVALPGVDIGAIESEVQSQCDALPRNEVARQALSHSCIVMAAGKVGRSFAAAAASAFANIQQALSGRMRRISSAIAFWG